MIQPKITRNHIGSKYLTTISGNHLETIVADGKYCLGEHAKEFGAMLHEATPMYRIYHSNDGVGIDVLPNNTHIVLTTSNNGTPFHPWLWLFIGHMVVGKIFGKQAIPVEKRISLARKPIYNHGESIRTFERHIDKILQAA